MRLAHAFASILALSTAAYGLDLTPIETTRDLEGIKIPVLNFNDTATTYARWQPPGGWAHSYDGQALTLRPKDKEQAFLQFRITERKAGDPPVGFEAYAKYAASHLPASFLEPVAGPTVESPFTLGAVSTFEFTFTAREFARPVKVSVFLADINDKQRLSIMMVAREADFAALRDAAVSSLVGWSWEDRVQKPK